ncbi:plasmid recombination protein [Anabaena sp. UHCC 0399]|uniref:plasmid recombination protein n=1 Tax=Anabaena sp. UHCC 0399 TaxID=3110238 RepID=UPI002B20BA91|nr:plasmid recombination protein [Anabaena sp. UHCC 0399]MEA5569127.1 plasmid recombination protein [Anabaena sp. UHCC 0399]
MAYAIARIKKLKRSSLGGSEAHTARQRETPNADRSKHNIRFIGNQNSDETLDSLVIQKIGEQKRKIRPDAVYAVEILLTASPEYFRPDCPTNAGYYEADKVQAWLTASKQWLEENYSERIVRAELHLDEATPHSQANRWKGHGHIINIDKSKFYDFAPGYQKGGGGAIDLVMHVNDCDFKKAISWLHDRFGESGVMRAAIAKTQQEVIEIAQQQPRPQFTPPAADDNQWLSVQNYLTKTRGLPNYLVSALRESELLYADERKNIVFGMRTLTGEVMGAFVRGTVGEDNTFMGYAKGTKRADCWFYLRLGGEDSDENDEIQRVILCKSPIDTLSVAALEMEIHDGLPPDRTMYLAVDSPQSLPLEFLRTIKRIAVTFDNDELGNEAAHAVKELLPQAQIVMPDETDWNQQLLATLERERLEQKPRSRGLRR